MKITMNKGKELSLKHFIKKDVKEVSLESIGYHLNEFKKYVQGLGVKEKQTVVSRVTNLSIQDCGIWIVDICFMLELDTTGEQQQKTVIDKEIFGKSHICVVYEGSMMQLNEVSTSLKKYLVKHNLVGEPGFFFQFISYNEGIISANIYKIVKNK